MLYVNEAGTRLPSLGGVVRKRYPLWLPLEPILVFTVSVAVQMVSEPSGFVVCARAVPRMPTSAAQATRQTARVRRERRRKERGAEGAGRSRPETSVVPVRHDARKPWPRPTSPRDEDCALDGEGTGPRAGRAASPEAAGRNRNVC